MAPSDAANADNLDPARPAPSASRQALFVTPSGRGDGFRASIRGHLLELADPSSGDALAPTPGDLFIVSIAADFAWSARRFLRAQGLPDDLSVSARWRTLENPSSLGDIHVTVTVPRAAGAMSDPLIDVLDERVAALSLDEPLHLEICAP
jgi:uncharacterized OsmC-like protein